MVEAKVPRPVTVTQVVGMLALGMIVFFIIAFAGNAITTYRLRAWRDDLQMEIASMDLERQNLLIEIRRRESMAWVDQALKETGQVPPDVLAVRLVSSESAQRGQDAPEQVDLRPTLTDRVQGLSFFDNPNWRAWMQLLFDRE
jgi:hypothetical protein